MGVPGLTVLKFMYFKAFNLEIPNASSAKLFEQASAGFGTTNFISSEIK